MRVGVLRRTQCIVLSAVGAGLLAACSNATSRVDSRYGTAPTQRVVTGGGVTKGIGTYKLGRPYAIAGRWYTPAEDPGYDRSGVASWYGDDFHGRRTANGEIYNMYALTAAHPTLPLPTLVFVTNPANGRTLRVRVNDRGPYARDRLSDLSRQTARLLGLEGQGTGQVRVRYAGRAPLDGNDAHERSFLAAQPWARRMGAAPAGRMALGAGGD